MIGSLHVAQTGLTASRTAVEGVMNNVANENTAGYKKRVIELTESAKIDGSLTGRGTQVNDFKRITNEYMYDNLLKEESKEAYYKELSDRLSDVESLFFETENSGFSSDLNRYFQAMENLRSDPNSEIYKNDLKNQANIIVSSLKKLYDGIETEQTIAQNTIKDDVDIINGILSDIGTINEKIGQQLVPPSDLLDSRDALEQRLSEYVDIEIDRSDDYELKIGGLIAVRYNTNIHNLSVVDSPIAQKDKINKTTLNAFTTFASGDSVTYRFNNTTEFTITYNDVVNSVTVDTPEKLITALAYQINNTTQMNTKVKATAAVTGTSNDFLEIESLTKGETGVFEGLIVFKDSSENKNSLISKDATSSIAAKDDFHVEIFDAKIPLKTGSIKALTDNLITDSGSNKLSDYKTRLNQFVQTFVDVHDAFVTQADGTYLYGEKASDLSTTGTKSSIGLFSGATVDTLQFNESALLSISQDKLDYLAKLQWKEDLSFDGGAQTGSSGTSFAKFYQVTQVQIASDKENVDYLKDTQQAITNSLQASYDKLVKVDKDEEMLNLIKYQSAYEANAKIITVVDEMLTTILGLRR